LEQNLAQKSEISLAALKKTHQAELEQERATLLSERSLETDTLEAKHEAQQDSLRASHRDQLAATAGELEAKHKAELVSLAAALASKREADLESLEAVFQETNQAQLEALDAGLTRKHQEERDELEKRMLGNMDTLEATYLKEVHVRTQNISGQTFMFTGFVRSWKTWKSHGISKWSFPGLEKSREKIKS